MVAAAFRWYTHFVVAIHQEFTVHVFDDVNISNIYIMVVKRSLVKTQFSLLMQECVRNKRSQGREEEKQSPPSMVFSLCVYTIYIYIHKLSTAIITNCSPHTSGVSH